MTEESKRNNIDIIKKAEALLLDYPEKELTHDDIGTISAALGIARVVISTYKNDDASDDSLQFWPKCRSCDSNMREHGEFSCKTCMFTSNRINHSESMLGNTPFQVFKNADEFCIANFLARTFCLGFGEEQIREWLHTPLVD